MDSQAPKILFLVLHSEAEPWRAIGETQLQTWMASMPGGCQALHYVGGSDLAHLDGTTLRLAADDGRLTRLGPKTLEAFAWAVANQDFDYVFRTNTSSYVDARLLQAFMADKPRESYYGGHVDDRYGAFASGCGYAISRDLCETLVGSGLLLDAEPDDVAVWRALDALGVQTRRHPRTDLTTPQQLSRWRARGRPLAWHYRCKGQRGTRPAWDCQAMREIHKIHTGGDYAAHA